MAVTIVVDASFLVTLLSRRDTDHRWADAQARRFSPPWHTCEAAISETFYLLASAGFSGFVGLLRREAIIASFHFDQAAEPILALMQKYADVPMSFADACLVRMTEMLADPLLLTADSDFKVYRRHSRLMVPSIMPR